MKTKTTTKTTRRIRITEGSGNVFARDVEIKVRPTRKQHGEMSVTLG